MAISAALGANADVEYAHPNYIAHAMMVPNDPYWATTGSWNQAEDDLWGLKLINLAAAWDISQGAAPYRGLFPSPPLFDRMPTYRTQGKRSLNFLSAGDRGGSHRVDPWPGQGTERGGSGGRPSSLGALSRRGALRALQFHPRSADSIKGEAGLLRSRSNEAKAWEQTRSRGKMRFFLISGVGKAGIAFLATFGGLDYLTRYGIAYSSAFFSHVAGWLPGSVVVGLAFGVFYWLIMEKAYKASQTE